MDPRHLRRLEAASISKSHCPDSDVEWTPPVDSIGGPAVPGAALSLAGTSAIDRLSESELKELAKHEIASMFSAFVRFESVLNQAISRMVRSGDPVSPRTTYLLRIIEEEAKHSRMFGRLVDELGTGGYPPRGFIGLVERVLEPLIANSNLVFTYSMFAVEGITDAVIAEILESGTKYPALRDVCRIHRIEEARHMSYAKVAFAEQYRGSSILSRLVLRCGAPWIAAAIYEALVPPSVYRRSGIAKSVPEAAVLWYRSHQSPMRMALRRKAISRVADLIESSGAVGAFSRAIWNALGIRFAAAG